VQPETETDPGPFTYAFGAFGSDQFNIVTDTLTAKIELDGAFHVEVEAWSAGGSSPPGSATLVFADDENPWNDADNPYEGNPVIPPPFPPGSAPDVAWPQYQVRAISLLVPRARYGVDYGVLRLTPQDRAAIVDWNTTLLGACPTTEIEALARELATADPLPYIP